MQEQRLERRVVTALFVDVVGSAALTQELGPERMKRALDRAFGELAALITAEGGTIEKYIGDAIHALFGVPTTHADDPVRALRAAHACVEWAAGARGRGPVPLAVRAGVETGEGIIDLRATETDRQQMSVGGCVNAAARLQQVAEPGQIVVGPACREASGEAAEFRALGEVELKGLGRLPAWQLVLVARPQAGRRLPFVGRGQELGLLRQAYARARAGRAVLALVSGAPGQGKTRLVEEFLAGLGPELRVLTARCRPAGEPEAGSPLRQLLAAGSAAPSLPDLETRLAGELNDPTERRRVVTALGHSAGLVVSRELTGLPAGQRQDEIVDGWRRFLGVLARAGPTVLWVDDLHWADREVVELLDRLTLDARVPVLLVATARPELTAQGGLRPGSDRVVLALDALDADAARSLARHAGGEASGIERAQGNPLFVIELARARSLGVARDVPLTLTGVIGARLEELPPGDRALLQYAAVVGETFAAEDVALLSGREPADVRGVLERLAELLYLQRAGSRYRFHHALVREVAYGRLTAADRLRLHARYAREGVRADDVEVLAHHLWEAVGPPDADWVWEDSPELPALRRAAREAHVAAGRRYADRAAYGRAVEACRRALRFASTPAEVAAVEQAIAGAGAAAGDADEAWAHYLRARDALRQAGVDPPGDLYASVLELPVYTAGMFRSPPPDGVVEALLREGKAVARRAGDDASLSRLLALDAYRSHDPAQLVEALRLSEGLADPAPLASCFEHAAILQNRVGDFAMAARLYERLDALGPTGVSADRLLEFRAILALNTGRLGEAERLAERYVAASASRGPHLRTHSFREAGHVLLARGDWPGLLRLAARTEQLVAAHGATAFCYAVTSVRAFAVVAHALEGRPAEARALLPRAALPLQAEPFERESVLLLAYGAAGAALEVARLRREARAGPSPLWFFHRMEAVVLAMLERWAELEEALPSLERVAASGSPYLGALLAALREEAGAAGGGPPPTHARLQELGYAGWSQLLRHRPAAR